MTSSYRSSIRRRRCCSGASSRDCRIARRPRLWLVVLAGALLALITTVLRASGAPRGAFVLCAALALAIAFGPITSDLALGQLALPAFLGATLLVVLADRSIPMAAAAATLAFAAPNVALGLASQLGRVRAAVRDRRSSGRYLRLGRRRRRLELARCLCRGRGRSRCGRAIRDDPVGPGRDRVRFRRDAA